MSLRCRAVLTIVWLAVAQCAATVSRAGEDESKAADFGGGYSSLSPQQQRLVTNWFQRFSAVVQKQIDPAEGYDKIPLSARTTFSAVTHALMKTALTDKDGRDLAGSALELVEKVDTVAGQIIGAEGDKQFRIYVEMAPGALDLLNSSREFKRHSDNTSYHQGFPVCFRTKGVPSIQISLTRDATRADIDVDYRSAKFPAGLLNGHLSVANSDVRADDNYVKHNNQWAGLQKWWQNLLGLPVLEAQTPDEQVQAISREPGHKDVRPEKAIYDFLNTWLVEQKAVESLGYFSQEAFGCMDLVKQNEVDWGMAKFAILKNMHAVNERIGKISSLGEVSSGVALKGEGLKMIKQAHQPEFVMYDVREDVAEALKCGDGLDSQVSRKAETSKDFGKYVGSVFRISAKDAPGRVVAALWHKDHGYWKLVAYDVDPELDRSAVPNAAAKPVNVPSLAVVEGDRDMIQAASDFLTLWLLKKNVDKALEYFASECFACADLYRPDDTPAAQSVAEQRALLSKGMTRIAATIGNEAHLNDAIAAAQPANENFKLVRHAKERAFVVVSIPEQMGEASACDHRDSDGAPYFSAVAPSGYGKYYATGFSLNEGKERPAVLWIVWRKINDSWKAQSYVLLTP